jgi:hypothetical protein
MQKVNQNKSKKKEDYLGYKESLKGASEEDTSIKEVVSETVSEIAKEEKSKPAAVINGVITKPCKLCDGSGRRSVMVVHKYSKLKIAAVEWCLCMKSYLVSTALNTKLVQGLKDTYLNFDCVDKQLQFIWPLYDNLSRNFLIKDCSLKSFQYHVKSVIMQYKFMDPAPSIYACNAIDILKDFFVAQNDGSNASLSELNKYDLLIFALGTKEKNDVLKTCLAQVVQNRLDINKPTWVYRPTPTLEGCGPDYSEELKESLSKYEPICLAEVQNAPVIVSKANQSASQFMVGSK